MAVPTFLVGVAVARLLLALLLLQTLVVMVGLVRPHLFPVRQSHLVAVAVALVIRRVEPAEPVAVALDQAETATVLRAV
jgi:hypothetical protein